MFSATRKGRGSVRCLYRLEEIKSMRDMFKEMGQTVRFAIADERRTARLKSLVVTTAIVLTGCYHILFVK